MVPRARAGELATPRECYLWELLKGKGYLKSNVTITMVEGHGRSAFAARFFKPGQFVCKYASIVRKATNPDNDNEEDEGILQDLQCDNFRLELKNFKAKKL